MDDRFKFRVFFTYNKLMWNISSFCFLPGLDKCVFHFTNGGQKTLKTKDFVLMQCTGLRDNKGKLIYEGDIIVIPNQCPFYEHKNKGEYQLNYVGIVKWIHSQWQYIYHCVDSSKRGISDGINNELNDYGWDENENTEYLILGNIYENKELLNE